MISFQLDSGNENNWTIVLWYAYIYGRKEIESVLIPIQESILYLEPYVRNLFIHMLAAIQSLLSKVSL